MKDGFIKVAAGSIRTSIADPIANEEQIKQRISDADAAGVNVLVLPELAISGYSCADLFYAQPLLQASRQALVALRDFTTGRYPLVIVGVPLLHRGKLYNCVAALLDGHILAVVPKTYFPNSNEFYELRQFTSGADLPADETICLGDETVPFHTGILLQHRQMEGYAVGMEICEDFWAPCPPSAALARLGATILVNASASNEVIGKADYRRMLVTAASGRLLCGYVYCSAGPWESTQDTVCSQQHLIAECGTLLAENPPFGKETMLVSEIDVQRLVAERHKQTSFTPLHPAPGAVVFFDQLFRATVLSRHYDENPFVPHDGAERQARAEEVLQIQAHGLARRMAHTGLQKAVVGISGGLDSCLALLVMVRAFDLLSISHRQILAVTMPCFGTTGRTKSNAEQLCALLGVTLRTIPIQAAVLQHFEDIGHDPAVYDATYENAQARERTQVLMDLANQEGALVVGTGDLSELALGWATYNGDHMSMYGVNASVPKTLVRYLVRYEAARFSGTLAQILEDILQTPVSPELLPASDSGAIAQKTEDLVGPYELHDFFLYYLIRFGFAPSKVYRLAQYAFAGTYPDETIKKWLTVFVRRFFAQQFKRSCLPDGPKVGSVSLSPRGDWRMPSDACARIWLEELAQL